MKLSIVATLYRSARTLDEFHSRTMSAAAMLADDVELILVNDGSPDDSLERALALQLEDPRIVVMDLARNFGHHKAMMTGLAEATGDRVFLIDSDLEEPPELLATFHDEMESGGWDVVYGVQRARRGGAFERWTGAAFFKMVSLLSDVPLPKNVSTVRLMSGAYVKALVAHKDREFQISHLWSITGFRQTPLKFDKLSLSPTTYTLTAKLGMVARHITTTSTKLLYLILYFGFLVSALSAVAVAIYVARYALYGTGVDGWTSMIVSLWFFGGTTVLILGIIGIYVANILSEVKDRPYTHLRAVYRRGDDGMAKPRLVTTAGTAS